MKHLVSFEPSPRVAGLFGVAALTLAGACAPIGDDAQDIGATTSALTASSPLADFEASPDYVRVPSAFVHRSCLHAVAEGSTIDEATGDVTAVDGTVQHLGVCQFPMRLTHEHTSGSNTPAPPAAAPTDGRPVPTDHGWILSAWAESPHWLHYMTAYFYTPNAPSRYDDQLIYLFPSMEPADGSAILQPVLQYGVSPAGGGESWGTASWYVSSTGAWHSPLIHASSGDLHYGSMSSSACDSSGRCLWAVTADNLSRGTHTTLNIRSGHSMYWAQGGVLEVYGVIHCADYPASHELFKDIYMENWTGARFSPSSWIHQYNTASGCTGEVITSDATDVRLYY